MTKRMFDKFYLWMVQGLGLVIVLLVWYYFVKWWWTSIKPTLDDNQKLYLNDSWWLTKDKWNSLVDKLDEIEKILPYNSIVAFNLKSCPKWWILADWKNGTLDLRWKILRWSYLTWDNTWQTWNIQSEINYLTWNNIDSNSSIINIVYCMRF